MRTILLSTTFLAIFLFACNHSNHRVITEPTDWSIDVQLNARNDGYTLRGKTNLPDNTELSISYFIDGVVRGQAITEVKNGMFISDFGENIINFDDVEILCVRNKIVQPSESVLKQLEFITTTSGEIKTTFKLKDLKRNFFNEILKYKEPANINASVVESVKDVPIIKIKRASINVVVKDELDSLELSNHIKHHLIDQLVKDTKTKSVMVRCFKENEELSFAQGVFAPNGEWMDAGEDVNFKDYTLVIK
ncbi:hypothetical protein [Saccharicrinis fermentans]|uniref:Lipoprotein n=2 Tax=Saccharicrinis fermentans TaxID=982 RepID=W7YEY4_9BACT|nr:hypothetical protein [Saccharicrinis fermentans]GAF06038.1 hypothetical protein JCM21142_134806 [Saccharicrinis fermentans DSM 9555 = JCM 21142]